MKFFLKKLFKIIAFKFGFQIEFNNIRKNKKNNKVNLNIGAGKYVIQDFKSLDLYTPHYYKNREDFLKSRIEYNIRENSIPFENNSVDNIYCSHVLEHIEDKYAYKFLKESFRVLKKRGVLRVACPDAEFLFSVSTFDNDFWDWRHPTFSNKKRFDTKWEKVCQYDFLMRELASPRMRFYKNKINAKVMNVDNLKKFQYSELSEMVKEDLSFREEHPGDHINNWDFERFKAIGDKIGYEFILRSKFRGSVSKEMRSFDFDKTRPNMSLYVEFIK
tara:strand:- start:366 stop:1187 length:822 start_codon:yes stop_codon:yes gene_type:complete